MCGEHFTAGIDKAGVSLSLGHVTEKTTFNLQGKGLPQSSWDQRAVRARTGSDEVREGRICSRGFAESDWSGRMDAGGSGVQIINTRGRTGWGKGRVGGGAGVGNSVCDLPRLSSLWTIQVKMCSSG